MSWVEAFGLAGVDVSSPGVADYSRGAIIQYGVGQGWSQNRIEAELRSAGVGLTAMQQRNMIQAEQARQGASATSAQLPVDYSTGELLGAEPPANWTGQYVHQVTMTYREGAGPGIYELHTRTMGIKSSVPLSPWQASDASLGLLEQNPESPNLPQQAQVLATQLTGVWYDTLGRDVPTAPDQGLGLA